MVLGSWTKYSLRPILQEFQLHYFHRELHYEKAQTRSVTTGVRTSESHVMLDDRKDATFAPNEHVVVKKPLNNFSLSAVTSVFILTFIMTF